MSLSASFMCVCVLVVGGKCICMLLHASACCRVYMSVCIPNKCHWWLCLSSGGDVRAVVLHHSGPLTMCWNAKLQWNTAYYGIFGVLTTMRSVFGCLWCCFQFIKLNTQELIRYCYGGTSYSNSTGRDMNWISGLLNLSSLVAISN